MTGLAVLLGTLAGCVIGASLVYLWHLEQATLTPWDGEDDDQGRGDRAKSASQAGS